MKFFAAAQTSWDVKNPGSGWSQLGMSSSAGVRVTQDTALSYSAVFAATRVISETLASLPLNVLEQEDARTTRKATDHPLWGLLHDQPNPEQDIVTFLDMQTAFQLNWGNAYAEIQRDSTGTIKSLLPIHPSRIPTSNIYRNGRNPQAWGDITVGQPGELVYLINNDDGTRTPIPASDLLHVRGVLSKNGITGTSIILTGAETIGIGMATERHAGAFFRNGAVSNMAIKSPKIVKKETAEYLREQWQRTFGGVDNHYKTLLLEDGMEPVSFSIAPEAAQLVEARKLGVAEVARLYRLQPHKLGDLSSATRANIEAEGQSFITDTMMPWVRKWEAALFCQLLTESEKQRYRFKFNLLALLRGDSSARAQFYQAAFNMGVMSPNDIREREDMNPIDGGDQYFVPGNNLVPLDKIGELADAQIEKLEQEAAAASQPAPSPAAPAVPPEADDEGDTAENAALSEVLAILEQRDTLDAERLAVRAQRVQEGEETLREALRLAIEGRIVGLTDYECRAIRQATNKPGAFPTWQAEFYAEFSGKLRAALAPFTAAAEKAGFRFNPESVAASYCGDSAKLLEPLLDVSCDKLAAHAEEIIADWPERPAGVAEFIIPRRSQQCAA